MRTGFRAQSFVLLILYFEFVPSCKDNLNSFCFVFILISWTCLSFHLLHHEYFNTSGNPKYHEYISVNSCFLPCRCERLGLRKHKLLESLSLAILLWRSSLILFMSHQFRSCWADNLLLCLLQSFDIVHLFIQSWCKLFKHFIYLKIGIL